MNSKRQYTDKTYPFAYNNKGSVQRFMSQYKFTLGTIDGSS